MPVSVDSGVCRRADSTSKCRGKVVETARGKEISSRRFFKEGAEKYCEASPQTFFVYLRTKFSKELLAKFDSNVKIRTTQDHGTQQPSPWGGDCSILAANTRSPFCTTHS